MPIRSKQELPLLIILMLTSMSVQAAITSPIVFMAYTDKFWQVWVMSESGEQRRQVTSSHYDKVRISWFPDGEHVLVNGSQGQLEKVNITTGNSVSITLTHTEIADAVISPDGQWIAYSMNRKGTNDHGLWVSRVDGSEASRLAARPTLQHEPVWSPDGESIYFLSRDDKQNHDIYRVSLKTKNIEQLTVNSLYHFDIALSQREELLFSSNRSGNYEIYRQTPNQTAMQITSHPALDAKPSWSPDETIMLFESNRSGVPNIWRYVFANKSMVQMTNFEHGARAPLWYQGQGQ